MHDNLPIGRAGRRLLLMTLLLAADAVGAADVAPNEARLSVSPERIAQAKQTFANICGFCHSQGGRKAGKGPKLANSSRSDTYMYHRIRDGKSGRMAAFGTVFDEDQIWALIAYIRSLDGPGEN